MTLSAPELETARDPRSSSELFKGLPHTPIDDTTQTWWLTNRYYQFYSALGRLVAPKAILEVGVRLGYSLVAMLRGFPQVNYILGLDNESGMKGSQRLAEANLRAAGYKRELDLPVCDATGLPAAWFAHLTNAFDLVHVDGDHSRSATAKVMMAGWKTLAPGGVMVVDDYNALPVIEAVDEVIADIFAGRKNLATAFGFQTYTGWWVGVKADD